MSKELIKNYRAVLSLVDDNGYSAKSQRVLDLWEMVAYVEEPSSELLQNINLDFFSDPALIVSHSRLDDIEPALDKYFDTWEELDFPFKDQCFIRTSEFNSKTDFSYPIDIIERGKSIEVTSKKILESIDKLGNYDQFIIHPRVSDEEAEKSLITLRGSTIVGGIQLEVGQGGVSHIRNLEKADVYFDFDSTQQAISDIPEAYRAFAKASLVLFPLMDEFLDKKSEKENYARPVYELKGFDLGEKSIMILFDYELEG